MSKYSIHTTSQYSSQNNTEINARNSNIHKKKATQDSQLLAQFFTLSLSDKFRPKKTSLEKTESALRDATALLNTVLEDLHILGHPQSHKKAEILKTENGLAVSDNGLTEYGIRHRSDSTNIASTADMAHKLLKSIENIETYYQMQLAYKYNWFTDNRFTKNWFINPNKHIVNNNTLAEMDDKVAKYLEEAKTAHALAQYLIASEQHAKKSQTVEGQSIETPTLFTDFISNKLSDQEQQKLQRYRDKFEEFTSALNQKLSTLLAHDNNQKIQSSGNGLLYSDKKALSTIIKTLEDKGNASINEKERAKYLKAADAANNLLFYNYALIELTQVYLFKKYKDNINHGTPAKYQRDASVEYHYRKAITDQSTLDHLFTDKPPSSLIKQSLR